MAFRNAHLNRDECTCPERNKKMQVCWPWHLGMLTWTRMNAPVWKMQVHRPWHSGMLTGTWMDAPVWKERNKCRSIGHGIGECSPGQG